MKRAQQHLFPLRRLKRFGMGPQILKRFYSCTIESITAWYGNCSASGRKALQRVVRTAQYITGAKLPAIQDLYARRCQRKAQRNVQDSCYPSHRVFSLLPHGKQYRSTKSLYPYLHVQIHTTNLYPRTLTRYQYPLLIASLLLFYCKYSKLFS